MPIYSGSTVSYAAKVVEYGGSDISDYMCRLLLHRGFHFSSSAELLSVQMLKDALCYTSINYDDEVRLWGDRKVAYKLPDNSQILLQEEVLTCHEQLFQNISNRDGLQQLVCHAVASLQPDCQQEIRGSIVVGGGVATLPNLTERLQMELFQKSASYKVSMSSSHHPGHSAWRGGSILASLSTFRYSWMRRASGYNNAPIPGYEEVGPRLVHVMCIP